MASPPPASNLKKKQCVNLNKYPAKLAQVCCSRLLISLGFMHECVLLNKQILLGLLGWEITSRCTIIYITRTLKIHIQAKIILNFPSLSIYCEVWNKMIL